MTQQHSVNHLRRKIASAGTLERLAIVWDGIGDSYKAEPQVNEARMRREKELRAGEIAR